MLIPWRNTRSNPLEVHAFAKVIFEDFRSGEIVNCEIAGLFDPSSLRFDLGPLKSSSRH
jgi:hypothetical protein